MLAVHRRDLPSCEVQGVSLSPARHGRGQALLPSLLGCACFDICYLACGHFLNVSGYIKRLLFLFRKRWVRS